jgi:multimeric flavodoxin WrbA
MNVLVLDGGPLDGRGAACRKIAAAAVEEARGRGHAVSAFAPDGMAIKSCQGCFSCWLKHPGTCAIRDDEEPILRALAAADILVWVTPVTFGGYGPALKKALDRFIPNVLPFFATRQGEAHHPLRYERRRALLVLGTLPAADPEAERIFHRLVGRNAINLASVRTESFVVHDGDGDGPAGRVREMLAAAEDAI